MSLHIPILGFLASIVILFACVFVVEELSKLGGGSVRRGLYCRLGVVSKTEQTEARGEGPPYCRSRRE